MKQVELGFEFDDMPVGDGQQNAPIAAHTALALSSVNSIKGALDSKSVIFDSAIHCDAFEQGLVALPPITLVRDYLNPAQQGSLLDEAQSYCLSRPHIQVFGQYHAIPRQQVWFGDAGCDYLYSGLLIRARPWPKYLQKLRQKLQRDFGLASNGVLVNRYADGKDCMGAHSDDEPEIALGSDIASLSLGASRDFVIKHKHSKLKYSLSLHSGDLLIMHSPIQRDWLHSVPKRLKVTEPRWNYTFRQLIANYHG